MTHKSRTDRRRQWCIAKNGGGYTQTGVAKGLKVPCLFMIAEVSIRCQKNPEVGIRRIPEYTPQYTTGRRVFKLGSKVDNMTRRAQQLFKVKRSKVKVTKSRDVSAGKHANAITRQCIVISTSNLVEIIDVGVDACCIISRSVGQTNRK